MAKKDKKNRYRVVQPVPSLQVETPGVGWAGISKRGWLVIGLGIGVAAIGYWVLTFTDPAGRNWASNLSPFLILGGYAIIGAGIMIPPPSPCK